MEPFSKLRSTVAAIDVANIDTDQIIPARFLNNPRGQGYGGFLFHDARQADPTFSLDRLDRAGAQILAAGANFGCGSSREAAVYALADAGIRCVIAPSFGDIFSANAVNNGLLPARVSDEVSRRVLNLSSPQPIEVDLNECVVIIGSESASFEIDPTWRKRLLGGLDEVDLTLSYAEEIHRFARDYAQRTPWSALSH